MADPDGTPLLDIKDVRYGFPANPSFLGPVSLTVAAGECWCIIGPNGAGKSTLLRLLAGLYRPHAGQLTLNGRSLAAMSLRERARRMAFVPQQPPVDVDLSVRDVVLLGRFPHRSLGLFESVEDFRLAERVMTLTRTLEFADRPMSTLSGGEAQRVHIAAALAQAPGILLLDEPTASLDLQHQHAIFRILRERTERDRLAVVVVTHDVNLARQYASRVLLLHNGQAVAQGVPADVVTPETLRPVYGVEMTTLSMPGDPDRSWLATVAVAEGG